MKKAFILIFIFFVTLLPVCAKDKIKANATMESEFSIEENVFENITFRTEKEIILEDKVTIPENSTVTAFVYQAQKEKRWHKAGFVILKLLSFTNDDNKEPVNIEEYDIYLAGKKYESANAKDVTITGVELAASTAASFMIPGVDILYYFTKGAILKEDSKSRFKSGVSNAYENSICWFFLKGRPVDFEYGDTIQLKNLDKEKAEKLKVKIDTANDKIAAKIQKKSETALKKAKQKEAKMRAKEEKSALQDNLTE